ncbi:hypothetical protein RSAG8_09651, partial [Rhizoctonia solani AG-8 WAC10335]
SHSYSIISPVITGLVFVAFFLFDQLWKCLFLAARDDQGHRSAIPRGALTIVLIFITSGYQFVTNDSYNALLHPLSLTLAHKSHGMPKDTTPPKTKARMPSVTKYELREQDFGPTSQTRKLEQERAEHEMHSRTAPAKAETYGKNVAEEGKHNEDPEDFTHPAAIEPQRVVWLPKDPLGVAEVEEKELKQQGIEVSTELAVMDARDMSGLLYPRRVEMRMRCLVYR